MKQSKKIVVRADASWDLGTGHIMRCLTLLEELTPTAMFVCTRLDGHLGEQITAQGHRVHFLEAASEDARETAKMAQGADLVVVDHYGIDATWEAQMPCSVMAIDDLADRPHNCTLLLDQNFRRKNSDYDGLVPASCICLTGSKYALLRPKFAALRPVALVSRAQRRGSPQHLMIAMGGTDLPDATGWVLEALATRFDPDVLAALEITVVMGPTAPHLDSVRQRASALPGHVTVLAGTDRIADLMVSADLAIGAAGSSAWERCALGLPAIMVVLAENQKVIAKSLTDCGAAQKVALNDTNELIATLSDLIASPTLLASMSVASAGVCDGHGVKRVVDALFAPKPSVMASV